MRLPSSRLLAAALVGLVACSSGESASDSDPRLSKLSVGMLRDTVLLILGDGASAGDSLPNVYRREQYLFNGEPLEIFFYSPQGLKEGREPAAAESTLRPIVMKMARVTGWGWKHFDSVARVHDIRARVR